MIVAIDGPAGVGKSSIAKMLAEQSEFTYLNSGSFYRAYTYLHQQAGKDPSDVEGVLQTAKNNPLTLVDGRIHANGVYIEDHLRTKEVDAVVAQVSAYPPIRAHVNEQLKEIAKGHDMIVEGRDITTVVFPDAELKIYFDAKPEVRAQRRYDQNPTGTTYEEVLAGVKARDEIDRNKAVGALKQAADALYIDTSYLTMNEVCERVLSAIFTVKMG
ncbi:MAG: (d)CMP kinase [Sphaerochaeta sp.]